MGLWQGQRTIDIVEAERAAASAPIPVQDAMSQEGYPGESIGRPVTAVGTFIAGDQLLVDHRTGPGGDGSWVVAPFEVNGQTVVVLRGWVTGPESGALVVPPGQVTLTGVLQPFEEFYEDAPPLEDGQLVSITRTAIERAWQTPVLPLVLVLASETPTSDPSPAPVPATVQTANVPFPLQNAAYTLQWFGFAVFVWIMWWYWVIRRPAEDAQSPTADSLES